jgi:hypothetical protein
MRILTSVCLALSFAANTTAQQVFPIAPTNTFHRVNQDPGATNAFSLPIGAFGVSPGQWLKLRCVGDWNNGIAGEVLRDMVGCFAATGVLLDGAQQNRLPQPIATGPQYVPTTGTANGNLPIDIAQDFWISRTGYANEVNVRVPAGSVHLFVCVPDSFYSDNTDLNGDLGIEVTVISPSAYPGSLEDCELGTAIGATATLDAVDTKSAVAGNVVRAALRSPFDTEGNTFCLIVADVVTTGQVPVGPLPDTWFGQAAIIALPISILPSNGQSPTLSFTVQGVWAGQSVFLQGGTISNNARNGLCTITNAHVIHFR